MRRKLVVAFIIFLLGSISTLLLSSIAAHEALGQAVFTLLGLGFYFLIQIPSPKLYRLIAPSVGVISILFLVATLITGRISHGAQRWLPIGPFHVQTSEFAKPALILVLVWIATRYPLDSQRNVLRFNACSLTFFLPVFLQPDLGSSLVFAASTIVLLFMAVKKLRMLFPWVFFGLLIVFFSWKFLLYPYQKDRLTAFFQGSGQAAYNAQQAYLTVGSGKLLGRGLGHGVQSQLKFLPEFHTDFFFASLGEEFGALGVYFVLILYLVLYWQLTNLPRSSSDFSRMFAIGMCGSFFFQMAVHMGMNMKLFPITGIPLPLLSSGGSSFLSTAIGLGLAMRLSDDRQTVLKAHTFASLKK